MGVWGRTCRFFVICIEQKNVSSKHIDFFLLRSQAELQSILLVKNGISVITLQTYPSIKLSEEERNAVKLVMPTEMSHQPFVLSPLSLLTIYFALNVNICINIQNSKNAVLTLFQCTSPVFS